MSTLNSAYQKIKQTHYTEWILYLLLFYFVLCLLAQAFSYSVDLGGMEFSFLYHIQYLEKYKNLYRDSDAFPFFIFYYPPLYPYLMYVILKFFNVQVFSDIHKALSLGRLISLLLMFADALILAKITGFFSKEKIARSKVLLLFMLLLPIHYFTFRPDSLKITFFLLFLYQILRYHFIEPRYQYLAAAIVFGLTGVFFKHDLLIYIMAYFGCHFLMFRSKASILTALTFAALSALGLLFVVLVFGPYVFKNLFYYNIQYSSAIRINLYIIATNVLRTLPLLWLSIRNLKEADRRIRFLALTSIVYYGISNMSLLRMGSNLNYTYESVIFLLLNFFICFYKQGIGKYRIAFVFLVIYLLLFNPHLSDLSVLRKERKAQERAQYDENLRLSREIRQLVGDDIVFFTNGKFVTFNAGLNLMYGYDLHLDRFTELYLHIPVTSKMFLNPSVPKYDRLFTSGFVKYVIIENKPEAVAQMKKFYKNFYFYRQIGTLQVFQYQPTI